MMARRGGDGPVNSGDGCEKEDNTDYSCIPMFPGLLQRHGGVYMQCKWNLPDHGQVISL